MWIGDMVKVLNVNEVLPHERKVAEVMVGNYFMIEDLNHTLAFFTITDSYHKKCVIAIPLKNLVKGE